MKLTNFGGATAILEHNGKRMFFDPWLDDGIFHGAWHHFPPLQAHIEDIGHVDYLYISHIHEDHCSAGTIKHINPDAEVILMDRPPNFVQKFLQAHGFKFKKIHMLKERQPLELEPGLVVEIIEADPANELVYVIDSALMIRWDGFKIYNSNDCRPYPGGIQYVNEKYGQLDLALLPYAGGASYPTCYMNLSSEEKEREKKRVFDMGVNTFVGTVKALNPKRVMPFADQYVVVGSRASFNEHVPHDPSPGVVQEYMEKEGLADKLVLLNSGHTYDLATGQKTPDVPYYQHTEADRQAFIEERSRDVLYDHEKITINPAVSVERLLERARQRLWEQQQRMKEFPDFSFYIDAQDRKRRWRIPLNENVVQEVGWDAPMAEPRLRMGCNTTLLVFMLIGHVSWNIADAAMFIDYERVPNVYNPQIYVLQNFLRL